MSTPTSPSHSTVYLNIQGKVNDIFALLVKQDLMEPHNSGPRCYLGEKYTGQFMSQSHTPLAGDTIM